MPSSLMSSTQKSSTSTPEKDLLQEQAAAMNRMYRWTRHVYDLSRKYYLLGRDKMLDGMDVNAGDQVLEVGCGTGRNLIRLAARCPQADFKGLDIAEVMIEQAGVSVRKNQLESHVELVCSPAEALFDTQIFPETEVFDTIYFSYSLSMIPTWEQALEAAWSRLKPGGELHVVDFWDQSGWPKWFAGLLTKWLSLFGVHFREELLEKLKSWDVEGKCRLEISSICRNYAYHARLKSVSESMQIANIQDSSDS